MILRLELQKLKRSGMIPTVLIFGVLGALYIIANLTIRKSTILSFPGEPMTLLVTQSYGLVMILNLFSIISADTIIYNVEHQGTALKKMSTLPISLSKMYLWKFSIIAFLFFVSILIQNTTLALICIDYLPNGSFIIIILLKFAVYSFIIALPVHAFMLFVSSITSNMWITLGTGIIGFFSGLTLGMSSSSSSSKLLLFNPFVLIMKPAMVTSNTATVNPDMRVLFMSILLSILSLGIGLVVANRRKYE